MLENFQDQNVFDSEAINKTLLLNAVNILVKVSGASTYESVNVCVC